MANKTRKRSRPVAVAKEEGSATSSDGVDVNNSSPQWQKVDVGLLAPTLAAAGSGQADDDDFDNAVNHYDAPASKAYRSAERELEGGPSEGVGFFFGLEVLDGSQYSVVDEGGHKRIVPKATGDAAESNTKTKKANTVSPKKEPKSTKPEAESPEKADEGALTKKKLRQKKNKGQASSDAESSNDNKETSSSVTKSLDSAELVEISQERLQEKRDKKNNKKKKKKQAKRQERANKPKEVTEGEPDQAEVDDDNESQLYKLQNSWMTATGGVTIRPALCKALLAQNFWGPTPIQAASLPAATLGRRNIVGAAPTGSGKTLAYLLPILDHLLRQEENNQNVDRKIQALILAPTRELALQVQKECNKLLPGKCGILVGGLATQKQERVLRKNKPPIIIGTPGRLWEMISSREHEHLNDMSQMTFLVIDECDRMTEQGSFPQLHSILDAVEQANPMDDDDDSEGEDLSDDDEDDDPDRLLSLPGVRGEAKVVMLNDDLLAMLEKQRTGAGEQAPEPVEVDDSEFEELDEDAEDDSDVEMDEEIDLPVQRPVDRQTFVYSATLTLPPSASYIPSRNKRNKPRNLKGLEGAIEEILDKARARGQTKVIDLSNSKKQAKFNEKILESQEKSNRAKEDRAAAPKSRFNLPPGLKLQEIKCIQMHKDSHLYAYLVTTREGAAGPSLVFCNSIAAVKRLGNTLKALGLNVRVLHANMQQRARFRSVESLQNGDRPVVVATDVAARGLDIPTVATVVHYDAARKVDGFVHRAGRTARGMGEKAVGSSLSLISPAEDKAHCKIVEELNVGFEHVHLDARLLALAQERANLASKVIVAEDIEGKARRSNQWFIDSAKEAGLEIDGDVLDEGLAGGDQREQQQLREAQRAKGLLQRLLAEPMVTQRYGKFLSSNTAAKKADVAPYVVQTQTKQPPKKKRRKNK